MKDLTPEQKEKMEERKKKRVEMYAAIKNAPEPEKPITGYVSVEGHEYSGRNQMFLAWQGCEFGKLGGFQQWRKLGRRVKKGSKGYDIMMPLKKAHKDEEGRKVENEEDVFFTWAVLFHESQTEASKEEATA